LTGTVTGLDNSLPLWAYLVRGLTCASETGSLTVLILNPYKSSHVQKAASVSESRWQINKSLADAGFSGARATHAFIASFRMAVS
jgi:hypothetical protein